MPTEIINPKSDRITKNPAVMGGKPCIRGMRVTVGMINLLRAGVGEDEILADYPYLEREDLRQSRRFGPLQVCGEEATQGGML